jgi:hypothetical protein
MYEENGEIFVLNLVICTYTNDEATKKEENIWTQQKYNRHSDGRYNKDLVKSGTHGSDQGGGP